MRPVPPRPKGELERLAVRRLAAMRYRLAGATYSVIAEKLTEDRAREYADAHDISVERAMKKVPHVSVRTVWDDVTAELEELRRETEMQRADLMALENARLDQGVLEGAVAVREWQRAGSACRMPTGQGPKRLWDRAGPARHSAIGRRRIYSRTLLHRPIEFAVAYWRSQRNSPPDVRHGPPRWSAGLRLALAAWWPEASGSLVGG